MDTDLGRGRAADVRITGGGTVFLFLLLTDEARGWVDERVSGERQMLGCGLAVEHRYAAALAAGMEEDGSVIVDGEVGR